MRVEKVKELESYIEELKSIKMDLVDRKSRFLEIESYDCHLSNGRVIPREKVIKGKGNGNACIILPVTEDGNVLLVVQPRVFTKSTVCVELPAGYVDEGEDYEEFCSNISTQLIYTGTNLINPIINNQIPIFVSTRFDEKIHIGIPSLSDEEENFVYEYELDFNPVFDYINDECILVNSGRFNGLSMLEAHEIISSFLVNEGIAKEFNEIKLDEIIISSNLKFGVPVPLHIDQSPAKIPVVHNLKHDVKLELDELADKTLVRDFLIDEFTNYLLPNAIRLKGETGILDFESMEALDEIGLFRNADLAILKSHNYLTELMWNIIFNRLFARYYSDGFDCNFKNCLFIKPILGNDSKSMHRENNNLVSISELIHEKGSSIIRAYLAASGLEDSTIYNKADIEEISELIDKIIKVYYYPIDEGCVELEISYQRLIDSCNFYAQQFDYKNYFEEIVSFTKKVHEIKHISRAQAKGFLIVLSIIIPSLAEQIKQDVLNLREPLYYYSWPE